MLRTLAQEVLGKRLLEEQQLEEGRLGVGVRDDALALNDLAAGERDPACFAIARQNARDLGLSANLQAVRRAAAGDRVGEAAHATAHEAAGPRWRRIVAQHRADHRRTRWPGIFIEALVPPAGHVIAEQRR